MVFINPDEFAGFHFEEFPEAQGPQYEHSVASVWVGVRAVWLLYQQKEYGRLRQLGVNPQELARFSYERELTARQIRTLRRVPSVGRAAQNLVDLYTQKFDDADREQVFSELLAILVERRVQR